MKTLRTNVLQDLTLPSGDVRAQDHGEGNYDAMRTALFTAKDVLSEKTSGVSGSLRKYAGRGGSNKFEEDVKKHIRCYHAEIIERVNARLSGGFVLEEISAPVSKSEADKRTMADITLLLKRPSGIIYGEPVNIKATKKENRSFDNTGSWESVSYAINGPGYCFKNKKQFFDDYKNVGAPKTTHDYYFWLFYKDSDDLGEMHASGHVANYFATIIKAFQFNGRQNLPLQLGSHMVTRIPYRHENKIAFMNFIRNEGYAYFINEAKIYE